ncbi:hypothetical protein D1872_319290 [compost metagenome]
MESIYRDYVLKQYSTDLEAYKRELDVKTFNPGEKYDRSKYLKRMKNHPIYKEAYKGIIF